MSAPGDHRVEHGSREHFVLMTTDRHPSTAHVLRYFAYSHLPERLAHVSEKFASLAIYLLTLPDGPELTVALRHLLEAKDAAVRAALDVTPVALGPASED